MDISTGLGLLAGVSVVSVVILMGGNLEMFVSEHAFIVIFGGSFAAVSWQGAKKHTAAVTAGSSPSPT
jgi:flagellar motor component MotA